MAKEAVAYVIDVGRHMARTDASGLSCLDKAKKIVRLMLQEKLLFTKRDELSLIAFGTELTQNNLNGMDPNNYRNITTITGLEVPRLKLLEDLDQLEPQNAAGDVTDALLVAADVIISAVGKKKYTKRIFLITDGAAAVGERNTDQLPQIAGSLVQNDFRVNVIGLDFLSPDDDDETKQRKNEERTDTMRQSEELLRSFCDLLGEHGAVFPLNHVMATWATFRTRNVRQTSKMRADFHLGDMQIPVWTFGKTVAQNVPSLKKFSTRAADDFGVVKMDRSYVDKTAEVPTDVPVEERVKGYRYGKSIITGVDADVLKYTCEKEVRLLGFMDAAKVHRSRFMAGTDVLVPEPGNAYAAAAVSALVQATLENSRVIIVRYVKRKNAQPLLAVLHPVIKNEDTHFFYLNVLPFHEDYRSFSFNGFEKVTAFQPSGAQSAAAKSLIESMNLDLADIGGGETVELLKPKRTFNPVIQRFYRCMDRRALDPTAPIQDLDPEIQRYLNPDATVLKQAEKSIAKFKNAFRLVKVEEKKKEKKRHWRDILEEQNVGNENAAAVDPEMRDVKRLQEAKVKEEGGLPADFDDIVARDVKVISSADPAADFEVMLRRRDDPAIITAAIEQMVALVKDLIKRSVGDLYYSKALLCVQALRAGCVKEHEAAKFNSALKDFKQVFAATRAKFLKMLQDNRVFPIDSSESIESTFSPAEAQQFYEVAVPAYLPPSDIPSLENEDPEAMLE